VCLVIGVFFQLGLLILSTESIISYLIGKDQKKCVGYPFKKNHQNSTVRNKFLTETCKHFNKKVQWNLE